jgi:perosamine synthetase
MGLKLIYNINKEMFQPLETFGDHTIYKFDTKKHQFLEFFQNLYITKELNQLGMNSPEFNRTNLSDIETSLHQKFYTEIKTNETFKNLYTTLIQDIHTHFFPNDKFLVFQCFPSVRFQFQNNIAVPPHCDSDDLGKHPLGEKNFLLPITEMVGTKRIFIESAPQKGDYKGIDLEYGQLFFFNGNKCIHYNEINKEDSIRISLDFRVVRPEDYMKYIHSGQITITNPRDPEKKRVPSKMIIGSYYQVRQLDSTLEETSDYHYQKDLLLQSRPAFGKEEADSVYKYMTEGDNFFTEFQQTQQLEKTICEYTGAKHAFMTTSGNTALILAALALELGPGDDVIVPNYTMIATINSIKLVGANPILVDVDPNTLTLSQQIVEQALTPNTKAIVNVSLNNRHTDLPGLVEWCKSRNIKVIEDAAQSLGCFLEDGKTHFGTLGDIGCFSLSTPKIISTGQGGILVTNNSELATKISRLKNFGRRSGGVDVFEQFGINAKFTDIQAVIGLEQMKKVPDRVKRLREIFDLYYSYLSNYIIPPQHDHWIPWFVDMFTNKRDSLMNFLKIHNIQTRATYPEIDKTPMYNTQTILPISNHISTDGLFLPTHMLLTDSQIKHICRLILFFFHSI